MCVCVCMHMCELVVHGLGDVCVYTHSYQLSPIDYRYAYANLAKSHARPHTCTQQYDIIIPHTHTAIASTLHVHLQLGYDVWGGYLSPVGDAYAKPGLAPAQHRLAMCAAAADSSPLTMVDHWEACQPGRWCWGGAGLGYSGWRACTIRDASRAGLLRVACMQHS